MPAPPSPPYPKNCGKKWDRFEDVTGEIPGRGGFGSDIVVTLEPFVTRSNLADAGRSLQKQRSLNTLIDWKEEEIREALDKATGAGGRRRLLTSQEEASIEWLLDNIEADRAAIDHLWNRWEGRNGGSWPLSQGDSFSDFAGGAVCSTADAGKWVTRKVGGRSQKFKCPSFEEVSRRSQDRRKIQENYDWIFQKLRCAEWGLNRILLYKRALAKLKNRDLPEFRILPGEPEPPDFALDPVITIADDFDLCRELGIGCPEGEEPEGLGEDEPPLCPEDFCPEDDLPPPDEPDLGEPLIPEAKPAKKKTALSDASTGLIVVGALGLGYVAYRLLAPR